jgi:tyrosyl-tRNA synthetase
VMEGTPCPQVTLVASAAVGDDSLLRDVATIVPEGGLEDKLELGRPLRIKLGLDPTAPAVTLGWAVVLRRLRRFQDAGHQAVLIVGDFTTRVGDPSGRSDIRPRLTTQQIDGFADSVLRQFGKIVNMQRVELRRNSEWLTDIGMEAILRLAATTTVARMLERDDFAKRYAEKRSISLVEFLYPLLQGYDSVAVEADVELGGTDQLFNLLMGRDLQREFGQEPQVALTMPLLEGLDGIQKMSQSVGNYVGIDDDADEMFGKLMSIPDGLIVRYLRLCTDVPPSEIDEVERGLVSGERHPNEEKRRMAREVVDIYHPGAGTAAEEGFVRVHREREAPADVPVAPISASAVRDGRVWLPRLLVEAGLAASTSEARRAITQGGVQLNGERLEDPEAEIETDALRGRILQLGRRRFVRIEIG